MAFEKGKQLIQLIDEREAISDRLDDEWEKKGHDEVFEAEWDRAYSKYWEAINELAAYLMEIIPGIDVATAKKMAFHKRNEMLDLFNRAI